MAISVPGIDGSLAHVPQRPANDALLSPSPGNTASVRQQEGRLEPLRISVTFGFIQRTVGPRERGALQL